MSSASGPMPGDVHGVCLSGLRLSSQHRLRWRHIPTLQGHRLRSPRGLDPDSVGVDGRGRLGSRLTASPCAWWSNKCVSNTERAKWFMTICLQRYCSRSGGGTSSGLPALMDRMQARKTCMRAFTLVLCWQRLHVMRLLKRSRLSIRIWLPLDFGDSKLFFCLRQRYFGLVLFIGRPMPQIA